MDWTIPGEARGGAGLVPLGAFCAGVVLWVAGGCGVGADPPVDAEVPRFSGEIDLSIGALDGDGPDVFARISGLAQGPEGRIFVTDAQAGGLRVFESDGTFAYTVGGEGTGPSEFQGPCCLAFGPEGRLWVRDGGNHRYVVFERSGAGWVPVEWPEMRHNDVNRLAEVTFDAQGRLVDVGMARDSETGEPGLGRFVHAGPMTAPPAITVPSPRPEAIGQFAVPVERESGTLTLFFYQPHAPRHLVAQGPEGAWATALGSTYRIEWHLPGDSVWIVERPGMIGPELSPEERTRARERIEDDRRRAGGPLPFDIPDRKPVLADLFFDQEGRLWVVPTQPVGEPNLADVYGRTLEVEARYTWPREVRINPPVGWIGGGVALGVTRDSLGVERVVRVRFREDDRREESNPEGGRR